MTLRAGTTGRFDEVGSGDLVDPFPDLHPPLDRTEAFVEAGRCLYCHDAPCIEACPTGIDIPTFIHQIRTGNLDGSAETILSANIMGGTCARACPTEVLCEEACVLNAGESEAIRIGDLQRRAVDHLLAKNGPHPFSRAESSGYRLAVIGAGPAGLAFAHRAAMLGHEVDVYEAQPKPGGLNEYGLAAYKMVDQFAQREVDFLLGIGGITVHHDKKLGATLSLAALKKSHAAVFIGLGLGGAAALNIPGEDAKGVRDALGFIHDLRQSGPGNRPPVGRDVVVIGGGNTAVDAAVQARRLGAETVTLVYRRGESDMGATGWERDLARREGVTIRLWSRPSAIEGGDRVSAVVFERTRLLDGRLQGSGESFRLPADMVLKAIGQKLIPSGLEGLDFEGGKIVVDELYRTAVPGIYAGGDCIARGTDLTVQAVEDGKRAAIAVDAALRTKTGS
ncbi:MAG: NAD(P)-dependent oxidoreductase [Xanthomonadales bacterium]|nr:NAD(P)-dependent oxidoreductase [Xanthomonadales bacterium]